MLSYVEATDCRLTTGLGLMILVPGFSWTSGNVALHFKATGSTDLSPCGGRARRWVHDFMSSIRRPRWSKGRRRQFSHGLWTTPGALPFYLLVLFFLAVPPPYTKVMARFPVGNTRNSSNFPFSSNIKSPRVGRRWTESFILVQ